MQKSKSPSLYSLDVIEKNQHEQLKEKNKKALKVSGKRKRDRSQKKQSPPKIKKRELKKN